MCSCVCPLAFSIPPNRNLNLQTAQQSLFESLVYSGFNFFTAMPILLVGIFDKDVKQQTATECHKLYAIGRLGMDLNIRVSGVTREETN